MAGVVSNPDPRIGMPLTELDTPTLLLDRAASDRNLAKLVEYFRNRPAKLRPHFKNHKCLTLAARQMAAGAVGMTCAKTAEAELLVNAGFTNVLIANQTVGKTKVHRVAALAKKAWIGVAIDHLCQATALSEAAVAAGSVVNVLVEVDIGMGRCGVRAGADALELVRQIAGLPGIHFAGIQAYEGHLVNVIDREIRRNQAVAAMQQAVDTRRMIEAAGFPVERVSGCSSATYDCSGTLEGVDEIQAGTYATMDRQYQRLAPEFEVALSILVRVISRPIPGKAVIDVGVKGAGAEFGVPGIKDYPEIEIPMFRAEEHCVIVKSPDWQIGELLQLIPSHACTTCNLYREMVVHENGVVVEVWPIEASGKLT